MDYEIHVEESTGKTFSRLCIQSFKGEKCHLMARQGSEDGRKKQGSELKPGHRSLNKGLIGFCLRCVLCLKLCPFLCDEV